MSDSPRVMSAGAITRSQFDVAADILGLEDYMRRILTRPFRSMTVEQGTPPSDWEALMKACDAAPADEGRGAP